MPTINYPGTPGTTIYGGVPIPTAGTQITTITLANTSGTTQAAGFVSPMFGLPLKQGDVPAGQYPAFYLADGTPVPATIHSVTSWPDGSMKWCGVFLRVPTTVAGSGTLAITVKNGGSAPGSSARALSDFSAAALSVELTGVTNLSGVWTATLADAIANGTAVQIGDGPAGAIWRVLADFKQASAPHGQLVCWHYVAALQNSSGGLYGIRYLGRVAQPWGDVSLPGATYRRVTGALKSGMSTFRSLQGTTTGEVVSPNIDIDYYTSFFTAGADAKWDYFQSGGSASADCTVRVAHDKAYFIASQLVPSYDTTVSASAAPAASYVPYGLAPQTDRNMGATGGRPEIGIQPEWVARHVLTQSAADEQTCRVGGLISAGWTTALRKQSTKQIVPVSSISPSYTGLGAIETSWRFVRPSFVGMVTPAASAGLWQSSYEPSHRPASSYYPYLITGEPQYLDLLIEQASTLVTILDPAYRDATISGVTYKAGAVLVNAELLRIPAWAMRDLGEAAAIYPDVCPAGTETRKYLRDVVESNHAAAEAWNNSKSAAWRENGRWGLITDGPNQPDYESPWAFGYLSLSMAHQAAILRTPKAIAFRQHLSRFYQKVNEAGDIAAMVSYRCSQRNQDGVEQDTAAGVMFSLSNMLTFSTATNRASVSGPWNPTVGDVFTFVQPFYHVIPFAGVQYLQRLYAVNVAGKTFQLATTPGGSPLTVTTNVSTGTFARIQDFTGGWGFDEDQDYFAIAYATLRFLEASGDANINAARLLQDSRKTLASFSPAGSLKHAMAPTFPG